MKKTKEQKSEERIEKNLLNIIQRNKFLADKKYYKNNSWSWAAGDSWAARGQAGGCSACSSLCYNATLRNSRSNNSCKYVSTHFCSSCVYKIEKLINYKFNSW